MNASTAISPAMRRLATIANYGVAVVLVLLPFHALFTTWAGSNFGYLDVFRIWKELIMVVMGLAAAYLLYRDSLFRQQLGRSWMVRLILIYTALFAGYAMWAMTTDRASAPAVAFSLVTNLRFIWFFLIVWVFSRYDALIVQEWQKLLFIPAGLVVLFGLLQRYVLPMDFLRHFGYGPDTIPAVQTIDEKVEYRRIQSTLRGANPLGAYLMLIMTAVVARLRRHRWLILFFAVCSVVLFFTYSRSAWIGLFVSLAVLGWLQLSSRRGKQVMIASFVLAILVGGFALWHLQDHDTVQNTLFHSDEYSQSAQSSNEARSNALTGGVKDIVSHPLGGGPGTAGPASFRNTEATPRIAENYFLQIGQEVGIAGLIILLIIMFAVARNLWKRRRYVQAQVLLATFCGITVINFLSHAWTDDTLSLLWWGLAGAMMSLPAILRKEITHDTKTKNQGPQKKSAA